MITGRLYPFTATGITAAPEKPGVYALYDGAELIYYGRALGPGTTIRSRLGDHRLGREGNCTQEASHFRCEEIPEPANREIELLNEFERQFGRRPRCNEKKG